MKKVGFLALFLLGAVLVLGCGGEKKAEVQNRVEQPQPVVQEKSEKQKAFEEHLAQKEAEFDKAYNDVKARNDAIRQKFDSL